MIHEIREEKKKQLSQLLKEISKTRNDRPTYQLFSNFEQRNDLKKVLEEKETCYHLKNMPYEEEKSLLIEDERVKTRSVSTSTIQLKGLMNKKKKRKKNSQIEE